MALEDKDETAVDAARQGSAIVAARAVRVALREAFKVVVVSPEMGPYSGDGKEALEGFEGTVYYHIGQALKQIAPDDSAYYFDHGEFPKIETIGE